VVFYIFFISTSDVTNSIYSLTELSSLLLFLWQKRHFHCIMSALLVLLIASFLASPSIHVLARDVDFCFADEDNPYLYMATKTAYHFVHGGKTRFQTLPSKLSTESPIDLDLSTMVAFSRKSSFATVVKFFNMISLAFSFSLNLNV